MNPKLIEKILKKTREDYNLIADEFDATRPFPWKEMEVLAKKYIREGDEVLDAGCGNGRLFQIVQKEGARYKGIDFSSKLVSKAKERYGDFFKVQDFTDLSNFKDHSFDVVFCVASLQHVPSEWLRHKAIYEFTRVLKPSGKLILINWNLKNFSKFKGTVLKYAILNFFGFSSMDPGDVFIPWKLKDQIVQRYYHIFSKVEIKRLFKKAKLRLKELYYTSKGEKADAKTGFNFVAIGLKKDRK